MTKSNWSQRLRTGVLLSGAAAGVLALSGGAASAQTEANAEDEIIVTATRREAAVVDIPLAVTSFSGEQLEDLAVTSLQDLTKIDATFAAQNYGAAFNQFIIRGVQSDIGSTVGMYIDEVPLTGGSGTEGGGDGKPGIRLHDLERVEVLRGPQGTLFGSGSMSGTLRVITAQPNFDGFEGRISASGASVDSGNELYMLDGMVNVAMGDRVAFRAVGWVEEGGGFIDQHAGLTGATLYSDVNDVSVQGVRGMFSVRPTDSWTLTAAALHQEIDVDGSQNWHLAAGPYNSLAPTVEPYADEYELLSLTSVMDMGSGTLTIAISDATQSNYRPEDTTPTANSFGVPFLTSLSNFQDFENNTTEIRFASDFEGPFQLVAGYYRESSHTRVETNALVADDLTGRLACTSYAACHATPSLIPNVEFSTLDFRNIDQYALYAQGDYEFTGQVTGTVGLRYYNADITDSGITQQDVFAQDPICATFYVYRGFGPPFLCGYAFGDVTVPYSRGTTTSSESQLSYNWSLLWEPTDDVSLYARAASGFRVGGVNNSTLLASSAGVNIPASFDPDSLWSYELGAKSYLFDRNTFLDFAVYQIDWQDQQLNATDSSGAFDFTINAGRTQVRGAELQITAHPVDGLTIAGGLVYTNARLEEDLPAAAGVPGFSGDEVPRVSEWAESLRVEYEFDIASALQGYVQGAASYRGQSNTTFNNLDPNFVVLDPYTLVDLSGGVRQANWDLRVFINNVTNEEAQYAIDVSPDGQRVYSPRPRTIGVRLSSEF
jgi:iron complex outermembrane recepter protein